MLWLAVTQYAEFCFCFISPVLLWESEYSMCSLYLVVRRFGGSIRMGPAPSLSIHGHSSHFDTRF